MGEINQFDDIIKRGVAQGELENTLKIFASIAAIQKIKFDALLREGFTETQALRLCAYSIFPEMPRGKNDNSD